MRHQRLAPETLCRTFGHKPPRDEAGRLSLSAKHCVRCGEYFAGDFRLGDPVTAEGTELTLSPIPIDRRIQAPHTA